jgi:alkylation response protein AidB-like acyl-CoA dehydrogenase
MRSGLRVEGVVRDRREGATRWIVPSEQGLVSIGGDALCLEPVRGFDPEIGLARICGDVAVDRFAPVGDFDAWQRALAAGRRSLASEIVGLCERMLADSVEYVGARKQFARALGSFQAVKHRLADVRVALGAARAGIDAAWQAGDATSAIAAKVLAVRAHRLASSHCHQVLGGIAFTTEHGFHRFIQRGHSLDALLGPADELTRELGRRLIRARRVPRVPQITEA